MNDFVIKKGDTLPILRAIVSDDSGLVDLSDCDALFVYKNKYTGDAILRTATVLTPTSGVLQYAWTTGDTSTAGVYVCEWRITFDNGKQLTFPNGSYLTFEIMEAIV